MTSCRTGPSSNEDGQSQMRSVHTLDVLGVIEAFQNSEEYRVLCEQTFAMVLWVLRRTVAERRSTGKEVCVVLDVDDTLLNNYRFNAYLCREGREFEFDGNWRQWCESMQAETIPGAVAFTNEARKLTGVHIIYFSDRPNSLRIPTRTHLRQAGFVVSELDDPERTDLFLSRMGVHSFGDRFYQLDGKAEHLHFLERVRGYDISMIIGDKLSDFGGITPCESNVGGEFPLGCLGGRCILMPNAMFERWFLEFQQ